MPDTNTSKMTAFMVAAKALVETVSGVGAVIIMGQRDAVEVFARAPPPTSPGRGWTTRFKFIFTIIPDSGKNSPLMDSNSANKSCGRSTRQTLKL